MAKRRHQDCTPDPEGVLAQLRSADEDARVKALHRVCPCAAGFRVYERFRGEVRRLQKDPSPRARAAALHVEQDACLIEQLEANLDRAAEQGWRYSDADWVRTHRRPPGDPLLAATVTRCLSPPQRVRRYLRGGR